MPAFSTTTESNKVVASILLMGVVQKYFDYKIVFRCGLLSVTLLGERANWALILTRLDKLTTFGAETAQFTTLLKPVISRFVETFDAPNSLKTLDFWQRIAHRSGGGSGPTYYSGWITAFCFWNQEGKCMYKPPSSSDSDNITRNLGQRQRYYHDYSPESQTLRLDGVIYHQVESDKVPPDFSAVPVKVDDNYVPFDALMVAGSVGMNCSSSSSGGGVELVAGGKEGLDTVAVQTGWWMFETTKGN